VTVTVKVQKDGSYSGAQPRLILKKNEALGVTSDSVLDTMSIGSGSFETLTGTTPTAADDGVFELIVDCDGTAGNVYIDSWTVDAAAIGDSQWVDGLPLLAGLATGGTGGSSEHSYPIIQ
jgi:hypothetical protein